MRLWFRDNSKLMIAAALLLSAVLAFWLLSRYLSPAPPRTLVFTAGATDGAYYKFAQRYKALLAREGIKLDVRASAGSVENLQRLQDPRNDVLAGFVQGGLGVLSREHDPDAEDFDAIQSLANVAFEPVWIFVRDPKIKQLGDLKGLRVAIGIEGSGTRKVALDLLQGAGLKAGAENWLPLSGGAAAQALAENSVDAVITVAAPEAPSIQQLLHTPGAHIVDLTYVNAISRLFPYLQTILLPQGVLDLEQNIPPRDITLLSTSANLVVSRDLHPALAYLLLDAAAHVHNSGGPLNRPGDFPHTRGTDYPLSNEAKLYFTSGKPFLQRYLPFWAANLVQRLLLILVPLIAVVVPILKLVPQLAKWRQERKLFRLYGELRLIELDVKARTGAATLTEPARNGYLQQLAAVDASINATKFAKVFADRVYTLRQHVDFVRSGLTQARPGADVAGEPAAPMDKHFDQPENTSRA